MIIETQRQFIRRLAALLGLSAAWMVALCAPALAHAQFVGAEPPEGAELQQAPEQVRIRFSEPVEAEFSPIEVSNSQGERVDRDNARVDPEDARVVVEDLNSDLPEDTYTVEWRATSVDGHVVEGTYDFTVASAGAETSQNVVQTEDGGADQEGGSGRQGSREGSRSTNNVPLYSAVILGALLLVVLAAVAVVQMRRR